MTMIFKYDQPMTHEELEEAAVEAWDQYNSLLLRSNELFSEAMRWYDRYLLLDMELRQ